MATTTVEQHLKNKTWADQPEVLPWYVKDLKDLQPKTKELFEIYSKVPSNELISHITQVRDKAFKIFPYPCLGHWGFLNLNIQKSDAYDEVVQRINDGEQYLDIGCCMGQDIRKLVYDGVPSENVYASDLQGQFWDMGYEMFLDRSSLKATFIEADVFDNTSGLQEFTGKFDIVHAASFFHLFDWDAQIVAAKRIISLLNPESNSLILGRQAARVEAGDFIAKVGQTKRRYWHNPESWASLWKQVSEETGMNWKVEAVFDEKPEGARKKSGMADFIPEDTKFMKFIIRKA
ncbi:methyltransferase domain-containing protein [Stagonosporopsis vannaccii]|nr:methyltransferase domain-containing protein [Stagonosporopsis vannaccii]